MAAVWLIHCDGFTSIFHELGITTKVLPALGFAAVASAPMLLGFALTRRLSLSDTFMPLLFTTGFAPLIEEIEYRGFGVRHLRRRTGWPFWLAVWPSTILFGWGHMEQGVTRLEMVGLLLITGTGGLVFAWLTYRWHSLWFAIMLHILMNLWWELFSVSRSAIGGWVPFALQGTTLILAVAITLRRTRPVSDCSDA